LSTVFLFTTVPPARFILHFKLVLPFFVSVKIPYSFNLIWFFFLLFFDLIEIFTWFWLPLSEYGGYLILMRVTIFLLFLQMAAEIKSEVEDSMLWVNAKSSK
jgi:hypothetical protein